MRSIETINDHLAEARAEAQRRTYRADALQQELDEVSRDHKRACRDYDRAGCAAAEAAYEDYRRARQAALTQQAVVRALEEEATAAGPATTADDVAAAKAEHDQAERAWIAAEDDARQLRIAGPAARTREDLAAAEDRAQQAYMEQRVKHGDYTRARDRHKAQQAWAGIDAGAAWAQQRRIDRAQNWQAAAA